MSNHYVPPKVLCGQNSAKGNQPDKEAMLKPQEESYFYVRIRLNFTALQSAIKYCTKYLHVSIFSKHFLCWNFS